MAEYDYGPGRTYAQPQDAIDACQAANETGENGVVNFVGAGLDDMTATSPPAGGTPDMSIRVKIDGIAPDTFAWSKNAGSTWEETGVAITGAEQILPGSGGIGITFASATGHTADDYWDFGLIFTQNTFAETNYIRGYGSASYQGYNTDQPVARLVHSVTGRTMTTTQTLRLVLDVDGLSDIAWQDDQGVAAVHGSDSTWAYVCNHVTFKGLKIQSIGADGIGILPNLNTTGLSDWEFLDLAVEATKYGIILGNLKNARIVNCRFPGYNSGAAVFADSGEVYGFFSGSLYLANNVGRAEGSMVDVQALGGLLIMAHNSFYAVGDVVIWNDVMDYGFNSLVAHNNILQTPTDGKFCIVADILQFAVLDANCYDWYDTVGFTGGLASIGAVVYGTLAAWQTATGQEAHSLNEDPLMVDAPGAGFAGPDFTLDADSPCRMMGRAATPAGVEGNERAISIDIGAYQPSLASNWSIKQQGSSFTAKIEGRIGIRGA